MAMIDGQRAPERDQVDELKACAHWTPERIAEEEAFTAWWQADWLARARELEGRRRAARAPLADVKGRR
jgi:hypothetical protein